MDSILSKHGASGKAGAVQPNERVRYARFARPTGKSDALLPVAYAQRYAKNPMSAAYSSYIEGEIRQIINTLIKENDDNQSFHLICTAEQEGMSSGIPDAFADALDRFDSTGFTNERFHVLIAELIFVAGRER